MHSSVKSNSALLNLICINGKFNTESMIVEEEDGNNKCQGLPTEGALMALVSSLKH